MRVTRLLIFVGLIAANMFACEVKAEDVFAGWDDCKKETGVWCSDAKGDEEIYACLLKHDSSLSKKCDEKDVTPYETKTGKPH